MTRHLVVGDVHGCLGELDALLALVADPERQVVFVGDLIAKGPDSRGVVRRAAELGALGVRGNHDEHALSWRAAARGGEAPKNRKKRKKVYLDAYESLAEEDFEYLEALPYHLALPEHGALVIHAGLIPGVPLEEQTPKNLISMRNIDLDRGEATKRIDRGVPWASLYEGPEHVFFGHDAVRGLQEHPFATGLDTGCVYGGELTAMLLPERELVSVPAERVWQAPGQER
ncbi:MAG: metallophosphatase [Deltaproteobacteria bacterium]|nr:MAG: metallophosphatase [Deltaproteobacteria bacterium]